MSCLGCPRCVRSVLSQAENMLDAMERLDFDDNCPLVVLDGQTSIEELFAELGFEWRVAPDLAGPDVDGSAAGLLGQATLF